MPLGVSIPQNDLSGAFALLQVIADPKQASASLEKIADAQKAADEKLAAANLAAADLVKREDAVTLREATASASEDVLKRAIEKQKAYEASTNADLQARIEAVTAREIAVSKVDHAAADRERDVANRESAVTDRENAVKVREESAAAKSADADARIARLTTALGA